MLAIYFQLAWQFYRQDYHQSHQRLLRWVQGILLLFILTLSLASNSIQQYLAQNLNGLLGADAVISQTQALNQTQLQTLVEKSEKVVVTQQITTTLTHNNKWQQAQLKAVGKGYPLQGKLLTADSLLGEGEQALIGPKPGNIWLDARLIASLSVTTGDTLFIGSEGFKVTRVLLHEPDRLMEGHSVAMRAMINTQDMAALDFSADLVTFRYLVAAGSQQISDIIDWQKVELPAANVLHKQGSHPLALFWQRTENFMGLASVILFFMAAIAIEQLAQVHMKKDQYFSAVTMSVGASKTMGITVSVLKWLLSIVLLLPVVVALSAAFHYVIIYFLQQTFSELTWQWQFSAVITPICAVIGVFAVFHAPVWFSLYQCSVANQLIAAQQSANQWLGKISSVIVLFIIAYSYSDNGLLTFMVLTAVAITILLMILVSWSSLTIGEKVTQRFSGLMPFALFMMKQRIVSKSTQILGVGLCTFLLLFTLMLLNDLGDTMASYQRQHDGNVFVSQASEEQMQYVEKWAAKQSVLVRQAKPYVHAKLVEINQQSLDEHSDKPSDSLATMKRAIRLHWSDDVPSNNRVVQGRWWRPNTKHWQQISIEQEVMTDLGLSLGDKLTFFINQARYSFEIVASHEVKPGGGSITFWVQMPPTALQHIEAKRYYMASIELKGDQWHMLAPLWQKFPTLRMVSLKEITALFDKTLAMVTQVISGFSAMIIMLSMVVILASIKASEVKEQKKNSVILSFGFSKKTCFQLNIIEWLVTATITAIGAIAGTYIAGSLIYQSQFSLPYQPNFIWLVTTLVIVLALITTVGVLASKKQLKSSVRTLLAST